MFRLEWKYNDFKDNERTQEGYFHLSEAELTEMELSKNGGLTTLLQKATMEQDAEVVGKFFKDFVLRCYGEVSNDGVHFLKSEEISHKFSCTKGYSQLYVRMLKDPDFAVEFIKGVMPKELSANFDKVLADAQASN